MKSVPFVIVEVSHLRPNGDATCGGVLPQPPRYRAEQSPTGGGPARRVCGTRPVRGASQGAAAEEAEGVPRIPCAGKPTIKQTNHPSFLHIHYDISLIS